MSALNTGFVWGVLTGLLAGGLAGFIIGSTDTLCKVIHMLGEVEVDTKRASVQ